MDFVDDFELLPAAGSTEHSGPYPLASGRVGAVAAPLSSSALLVVGGNLGSAAGSEGKDAAELLVLGTTARSTAPALESGATAAIPAVAHATLSAAGDGALLLAGGLGIGGGKALAPAAKTPLLWLTGVNDKLRVSPLSASSYLPAAYQAALSLPGGDVLLSGGWAGNCSGGRLCAGSRAHRYQHKSGALRREQDLRVPRLGHRATPLPGGAVLLSGGLAHDGSRLATLVQAELYAPPAVDLYGHNGVSTRSVCGE